VLRKLERIGDFSRGELMGKRSLTWGLGALLVVFGAAASSAQQSTQHAGEYSPADIQVGSTIYVGQCTQCHGPTGDSIAGVDLRSGRFRNASSDDDLRRIVTVGIPGTSMPGRKLDPPDVTAIVAYLRNMRDFNSASVALGDRDRGRAMYDGKGKCGSCHVVNGTGSHLGPDLSDIGRSRAAGVLQQSLLDPSSRMMPINRPVKIVTKDGKTISGRRLNEDTYTVQIIDEHEQLRSLSKADFREYTILKSSPMPSYKDTLTAAEIGDLVAYLVSLKGR
jgi:putative heme-binding domain-containing protein